MAEVFGQEGEKDTGHDDGRGGGFVFEPAETLVAEHEFCVGVELLVRSSLSQRKRLTWTNAVERMTPVPNCLMMVDAQRLIVADGSLTRPMGRKTPIELVTRTTKSVPMRSGMS